MALYYFLPLFVMVFLGTLIASFLTFAMGNPRASITRAFGFSIGKLGILFVISTYFSFYEYWIIFLLFFYYLLFLNVYKTSYAVGLRFLFLSTIFSITTSTILVDPLTRSVISVIY